MRHFIEKRDIFPHVRQDAIERRIKAGQCIYQDGVVITFQYYQKSTRIGDVQIPKGAVMLHQILNSEQFNGNASRVFEEFYSEYCVGSDLFLAVRESNAIAWRFYERHKMKVVGTVIWDNGKMPGVVYRRQGKRCTGSNLF
jgi:hypothetical protein